MSRHEAVLKPGESIGETVQIRKPDGDYDMTFIRNAAGKIGDVVLLGIYDHTPPLVLVAGQKLSIFTLYGKGLLRQRNLNDSSLSIQQLMPGTRATVSPDNTLYWFENTGQDKLIVRDESPGFVQLHEPSLPEIAQILSLGMGL